MESNKRGLILVFLFCILLSQGISADTITGAASSQNTGINVYVLPSIPILRIDSPENINYKENEYILLDYTATLIDTIWYNLDQGTNTTINSSFYFQADVGTHTLYLFGNQSNGTLLTDQVTFYVEEEKDKTSGSKKIIIEDIIPVTVEKERINISLRQGESKIIQLLVINDYNKKVRVDISRSGLEEYLMDVSETEFYLEVGESKIINLNFAAVEDAIPNLYLGKLFVNTKTSKKEIILAVEVESIGFLFDVKVNIPKESTVYEPGEDIIAIVDFYNLGVEQTNVNIEYIIKDEDGNIVFGEKQILIIGKSISLTKVFTLPENIEEGNYVFYVKIIYDSKTASASKWFTIKITPIMGKELQDSLLRIEEFIKKNGAIIAKIITAIIVAWLLLLLADKWWLTRAKRRKKKKVKTKHR